MRIEIYMTAADLDPNATTEDPDASLSAYLEQLEHDLKNEYPGCSISHTAQSSDRQFRLYDVDDANGDIGFRIQKISETVYEVGDFWR